MSDSSPPRLHIYWLTGPLLALLFPVTNTLDLPLEWTIYWVQHFMLLLTPLYLTTIGGQFHLDPPSGLAWPAIAFSLYSLYHWVLLQPIGKTFIGGSDEIFQNSCRVDAPD